MICFRRTKLLCCFYLNDPDAVFKLPTENPADNTEPPKICSAVTLCRALRSYRPPGDLYRHIYAQILEPGQPGRALYVILSALSCLWQLCNDLFPLFGSVRSGCANSRLKTTDNLHKTITFHQVLNRENSTFVCNKRDIPRIILLFGRVNYVNISCLICYRGLKFTLAVKDNPI